MAAHRKADRRRVYLCADGLRKRGWYAQQLAGSGLVRRLAWSRLFAFEECVLLAPRVLLAAVRTRANRLVLQCGRLEHLLRHRHARIQRLVRLRTANHDFWFHYDVFVLV